MISKRLITSLVLAAAIGLPLLASVPALAADFNPDNIISDAEMRNYGAMDLSSITNFLSKRSGTLANYLALDKEGNFKTAAQSFYEIANRWYINPKYLLILVQKEQGLLENPAPTQRQYDWATGYGCPDGGGCDSKYQGFYKQVNSAAAQMDWYLGYDSDRGRPAIQNYQIQPGKTSIIDGQSVTPANAATAGLYNYTPHVDCNGKCGGSKSVWTLWNKYFSQKWPDGSLLQADDDTRMYYIEDGTKREVVSNAVLASRFNPKESIISVSPSDLDLYPTGNPIKYVNFSLLRGSSSDVYMLVGEYKRKIANMDVFRKLGFQEEEIMKVSDSDLAMYKDGTEINEYTLYPTGKLLQDKSTGEIYYVLGSTKRLVATSELLKANFPGMTPVKTDSSDLNMFPAGNPVTMPEGTIMKASNAAALYVISNGMKLPILNATAFNKMKFSWKNVWIVSPQTAAVHPTGQVISGDW